MRADKGTTRKYASIEERDHIRKLQKKKAMEKYRANNKEKIKEASRKYRESNKEKCIERAIRWQCDNKDRVKHNTLKRKYGITLKQYNYKLKTQGNCCKICGSTYRLVVDHCHTTGVIRDILCDRCNVAIGCLNEDVNTMKKAVKYLEEWSKVLKEVKIEEECTEPAKDGADPLGR